MPLNPPSFGLDENSALIISLAAFFLFVACGAFASNTFHRRQLRKKDRLLGIEMEKRNADSRSSKNRLVEVVSAEGSVVFVDDDSFTEDKRTGEKMWM